MRSRWPLMPVSSCFAEHFLPNNTWTEIILLSQTPINDDVYACTIEKKNDKKVECMRVLTKVSECFEKIEKFEYCKLVAVEVDGKWRRGRLISYNSFAPNENTTVELIDDGFFRRLYFENIFELYFYKTDEPFALFIKFKNFIPKTRKLIVKPHFLDWDSMTSGFVLVDVKLKDSDNEVQLEEKIVKKDSIPNFHDKLVKDLPFRSGDNCRLLYFEDFMSIYICPAEKNVVTNYYKQSDYDFHKEIEFSKVFTPKKYPIVGDLAKVVSPYFCMPFRAEIINKTKDNKYDVFYIDFGNIENVPSNVIFEMDESFEGKPGMAVKVGMSDLKHIENTEEVNNIFEKFNDKLLVIEFNEESKSLENVKLIDPSSNGRSINEYISMIQVNKNITLNNDIKIKQLSSLTNEDPVYLDLPVCNGILSQDDQNNEIVKVKNNITDDFQSVNFENGDYCIVSYFESLESIFLCKAVKDFDNCYVTHNFDVIFKTMSNKDREVKINISVGDFVKVLSPYYKDMYRATIIDIIGSTEYHVCYIDFGCKEIVHSSDIFKLSDDLKIMTKLPLQVAIDVPSNINETVQIKSLFENLVDKGIVLSINFKTKNPTGIASVILYEVVSGKSVNMEVLKLLPSKIKMPLKNCDVCSVSHFINFKNMFVLKKENVSILFDTLNSLDRNIKTNLAVGDLVKIFSPDFDGLFRAEIVNFEDKEHVKVYHIDFGSTELVSVKNVFELSESLKIQPGIAIKVGMKVPNNVKINEEIKKLFLTLCDTAEPLSIEFDDSCEEGLQNCTFKVISNDVNLIDTVLKLSN